eukprot:scaffold1772_cov80-Cylindrotheca_fusiformis.AAC.14
MAVPYLRNPNRSRRGLNNVKLSKSTYHQEPEYYHHVGRRTKGGGGGGYVYGSSSVAASRNEGETDGVAIVVALAAVFCFLGCVYCWYRQESKKNEVQESPDNIVQQWSRTTNYHNNDHTDTVSVPYALPTPPTTRQQQIPSVGVSPNCCVTNTPSRQEMMLQNFKFQTVLPDKSNNIDPRVLREEDNDDSTTGIDTESSPVDTGEKKHTKKSTKQKTKVSDDGSKHVSSKSKKKKKRTILAEVEVAELDPSAQGHDDDADSVIRLSSDDKEGTNKNCSKLSLRFLLSTWRRPEVEDECAICLQGYDAGQVIGWATTTQCNHVFHQDCMEDYAEST